MKPEPAPAFDVPREFDAILSKPPIEDDSTEGSSGPQEFWAKLYGQEVSPYELLEIRTNLLGLVNFLIENGTSKQG